jgi:hypothetical protein
MFMQNWWSFLFTVPKTSVLFNSETPCVGLYLKVRIIDEPNNSYARIIIGALFTRAKRLKAI